MKDLLNHSKWSIALTLAGVTVGFVISIVTARTLGPAGRGQYSFALLIMGMVALFANPGLYAAANYYVSSGKLDMQGAFGTGLLLTLPFAGLSLVVASLSYLVTIFLREGTVNPATLLLAALVGVGAGVMTFGSTMSGVIIGARLVRTAAIIAISSAVIQGTAAVTYTILGRSHTPVLFVAIFVGGQFIEMASRTLVASRGSWKGLSHHSENYRKFLEYGLPVHVGRVLLVGAQRIDAYFVFILAGQAALGLYSISSTVAEQLWLLPTAVSMVMMANIAYRTTDDAARVTSEASQIVTLLALVGAGALALAGTWLIPVVFGPEFAASVVPFLIMLPGIVAVCIYPILEPFFQSRLKPWIPVRITIVAALSNALLCVILIPRSGIVGAAVAYSLSYWVQTVLAAVAYSRLVKGPVLDPLNFAKAGRVIVATWITKSKVLA